MVKRTVDWALNNTGLKTSSSWNQVLCQCVFAHQTISCSGAAPVRHAQSYHYSWITHLSIIFLKHLPMFGKHIWWYFQSPERTPKVSRVQLHQKIPRLLHIGRFSQVNVSSDSSWKLHLSFIIFYNNHKCVLAHKTTYNYSMRILQQLNFAVILVHVLQIRQRDLLFPATTFFGLSCNSGNLLKLVLCSGQNVFNVDDKRYLRKKRKNVSENA